MPSEEAKARRAQSGCLNAQSSREESSGSGGEDVFVTKRVKLVSIGFMFLRHLDPAVCVFRLLRVIWQRTVSLCETGARQMGRCVSRYYGNLQWFTYNHPPMVLFTLSILCFALILTLLTFYVSTKAKINKVDSSQDWNRFLQSFSNLEFCVIQDNSSVPTLPKVHPDRLPKHRAEATDIRSISVKMSMTIHPTREFISIPHSMTHLSANMNGKYIGLKGDESRQRLNITMLVPYHWNLSTCSSSPLLSCETVDLDVCIELTGPKDMFPLSNRRPRTCAKPSLSGVDYWAKMNWQMVDVDSLYYCRSRTMIGIQHEYDPNLFQPLQENRRSNIRLHLLHTSFFLYMFVTVVFTYAVIFNHAKQVRLSQVETPVYNI